MAREESSVELGALRLLARLLVVVILLLVFLPDNETAWSSNTGQTGPGDRPTLPPDPETEEDDRPFSTRPQPGEALPSTADALETVPDHPFLLVTDIMYTALQERASGSPWAEMKASAQYDCENLVYDPALVGGDKSWRMREITSSCALSYILDPANRPQYKAKLLNTYPYWDDIYPTLNPEKWGGVVPQGSAFFNSLISLDIIHDDLTPDEQAQAEAKHALIGEWFWDPARTPRSEQSWYATRGIWAIYKGDRARIDDAKADYRQTIFEYITPDGIYTNSATYAQHRFSAIRDAKAYFMDVLEFTGEDTHYYNNPRLQRFYEWDFAQAMTPFKKLWTFGDTSEDYTPAQNEAASYRGDRFSAKAAGHAAWLNESPDPLNPLVPLGRITTYVLDTQPLPSPLPPASQVDLDAGAWFYPPNLTAGSLAAALWNPIDPALVAQGADPYTGAPAWSHAHKDVNAVHLAAYGEHVLRNSGYAGAGMGSTCSTWTFIHSTAESSNTVLINGVDHNGGGDTSESLRVGAGLTEAITFAGVADYASGDSGPALPNGKHVRNLVFVHPQDDVPGYFLLFDEVTPKTLPAQANVVLHPNDDAVVTVQSLLEYNARIDYHPYSANQVQLAIFQGTPPQSVDKRCGALASWDYSIPGEYLYSTYDINTSTKNIVTVLYPYDLAHPKAQMSRITGTGYTGAKIITSSSYSDVSLESSGSSPISYEGVSFQGKASFYRLSGAHALIYFVRKGKSFNDGITPRLGFESSTNISILMKNKVGQLVTSGGDLTLYYPQIEGIVVDGNAVSFTPTSDGGARFSTSAGTHTLSIISPIDPFEFTTVLLPALADTEVNSNYPTTNFGSSSSLGVDATPIRISYLKFDLSSLAGVNIQRAALRFMVSNGSLSTQVINEVSEDGWNEMAVTYNNRPTLGGAQASITYTTSGAWYEANITALAQQEAGSILSIGIDSGGGDNLVFNSKEAGADWPELVVSYSGEPPVTTATPTPAFTPTATPTSPGPTTTATRTPTSTATATATAPPTPTTPPNTIYLPLVEDAEVKSTYPSTNFGSSIELGVDYTPIRISYLKFNLASLAGLNIQNASLRFKVTNGSLSTQNIKEVSDDSWSELSLTYNNRPTLGPAVFSFSGTLLGAWVDVDLTSLVTREAGGILSLSLDSSGGDNLLFYSRDSGIDPPELVVSYLGEPPPITATPTPTYTPTSPGPTPTRTPTSTPTRTPTLPAPSHTPTSTPTQPPASAEILYVSSTTGGTVSGISFDDEDILAYNRTTGAWAMFLDGSDVGLAASDIGAFDVQPDGSVLISLSTNLTVPDVGYVTVSDIIRFIPASTGSNTSGSYAWYFDGSDVGLADNSEAIDAIGFSPEGDLLVSVLGSFSVSGASGFDEDLAAFKPTSLGSNTSGSWRMYFDGSDAELEAKSEDVNGTWVDPSTNEVYLTVLESFSVTGASGDYSDIFVCTPSSLGTTTACTYRLYWDGSSHGFSGEIIDGVDVQKP